MSYCIGKDEKKVLILQGEGLCKLVSSKTYTNFYTYINTYINFWGKNCFLGKFPFFSWIDILSLAIIKVCWRLVFCSNYNCTLNLDDKIVFFCIFFCVDRLKSKYGTEKPNLKNILWLDEFDLTLPHGAN